VTPKAVDSHVALHFSGQTFENKRVTKTRNGFGQRHQQFFFLIGYGCRRLVVRACDETQIPKCELQLSWSRVQKYFI
jgi:hypothetical protein